MADWVARGQGVGGVIRGRGQIAARIAVLLPRAGVAACRVLLVLVVALLGAGAVMAEQACPQASGAAVKVVSVDGSGDLNLADGRVLRLAGLIVASAEEAQREAFAGWGRREVEGREIAVAAASAGADRYGRIAGIVTPAGSGETLQQRALGTGLAVAFPEPGYLGCMKMLLAAEAPARSARRGLWAVLPLDAHDEGAVRAQQGRFTILAGRIDGVGKGRTLDYLNFGRAIRHDTTLRLTREQRARLEASGVAVDALAGRRVTARGVVFEAGGPAIDIDAAEQLEP